MIRNLLALLGLAAIGLAAAIALQASGYAGRWYDDGTEQRRIKINYDGLDLTSPAGLRILERRIDAAISVVCQEEDVTTLGNRRDERACRREAAARVDPQVEAAIAHARLRADYRERPSYAPPPPRESYAPAPPVRPVPYQPRPVFAPPSEVAQPLPPEYARSRRLVRRTMTTTTVTTTRGAQPVVRPYVGRPTPPPPAPHYGRTAETDGSWLPPGAWRAIERATASAFVHGHLVRWAVPGREGYVTVSAARWTDGLPCRAVQVVKYAPKRQIVVAQGTRCRLGGGGLTD